MDAQQRFRLEISARPNGEVVLECFGELSFSSLPELETALDAMRYSESQRALIDLTRANVISGSACQAISQYKREFKEFTVRVASGIETDILELLDCAVAFSGEEPYLQFDAIGGVGC
jgi:hypothetical protein